MVKKTNGMTGGDGKLNAVISNPTARAVASKLVVDVNKGRFTRPTGGGEVIPGTDVLGRMSAGTSQAMTDANNILETMPDIEHAMQIMVSGILSPSDLRSPKPTFIVEDTSLDSGLMSELLTVIQEHFTKEYKIDEWFADALEDALFKTGSYPLMIVPENSLDDIINNRTVSTEAFNQLLDDNKVPKGIGLLGPGLAPTGRKRKTPTISSGLESFFTAGERKEIDSRITTHLTVTDNFGALKIPKLVNRFKSNRAHSAIWNSMGMAASLESQNISLDKVSDAIFHRRDFKAREVIRIKTSDQATRAPIGHPLVMKLPSDAYIPVHVPSNPREHLGGFVLMDEFGYPLSNATESTYYRDLNNAIKSGAESSEASKMLSQSRYFQSGLTCNTGDNRTLRALSQAYSNIVEKDLLERLKNGYNGEAVEIAHPEEVYRIMFSRAIAGRQTMLLYVPAELMTYIAFDYNQVGIGRSLLDKTKILASIRATLMFANTMAAIKNSTARQNLVIELEEHDDDPEGTVEYLVNEFVRLQSNSRLSATTSPLDIITGIQRANVSVAVSGNPNYPETKVGVEDAQSQRVAIDTDFAKGITSSIWMSFGLAPEIIDDMQRVEFAASQITSNALMTKKFAMYQDMFCNKVSDFVRKYTLNSGKLMGQLILAIRRYKKELKQTERVKEVSDVQAELAVNDSVSADSTPVYSVKAADEAAVVETEGTVFEIIGDFMEALRVQLPPPDDNRIEAQAEAFGQFSDLLEKVIDVRLSDDILDSIIGESLTEHKAALRAAIKATYQRRWLIRNNVLPELEDLKVREGEGEGESIVGEYIGYVDDISTNLMELMEKIKAKKGDDETQDDTSSSSDGSFSSDDTATSDDPLDFDLDGGSDAPAADGTDPLADGGDDAEFKF